MRHKHWTCYAYGQRRQREREACFLLKRGFTLVELLAVLVIVLVLLALLLPMLRNLRGQGDRVVCVNNLGVLGKGFLMYPPDNGGDLMISEPERRQVSCWVQPGNTEKNIKDGALWPYVLDQRVYHCPAHPHQDFLRSYSWNDFVNGGNYAKLPLPGVWQKIGQIPLPNRTLAQMDDIDPRGLGYLMGTWVIDVRTKYRYVDPVPSWHGGGMCLNFMDGHAEYWKWKDPRTLTIVTPQTMNNMKAFYQTHAGSDDWWRLRQAINPGYPDAPPPDVR